MACNCSSFARPNPAEWSDNRITAAWLGHATVLINFFGIKILTDPVLFPRIGIRLPALTLGPKRLAVQALIPTGTLAQGAPPRCLGQRLRRYEGKVIVGSKRLGTTR